MSVPTRTKKNDFAIAWWISNRNRSTRFRWPDITTVQDGANGVIHLTLAPMNKVGHYARMRFDTSDTTTRKRLNSSRSVRKNRKRGEGEAKILKYGHIFSLWRDLKKSNMEQLHDICVDNHQSNNVN